ncbi:MAG: cupredoxin domain-containing protein [Pseudolabrys sp.]|nr:cupredoxin domain-containing protein [Pseudolabrys sp.]
MKALRPSEMAAGICIFLAAAVLTSSFAPALAQAAKVTIASFKFGPDTVTAAPNASIVWVNNDSAPHQVVVTSKNLKTAVLNSGQSGELKIAEAGTYDYVCGIHPSMKGKIVVK